MHLILLVAAVAGLFPAGHGTVVPYPRPCNRYTDVSVDTTVDAGAAIQSKLLRPVFSSGPAYPPALRNARVDGVVHVTFVLDTTGRVVRRSAQVLDESERAFGESVCTFLARARFTPVTIDGKRRRVRFTNQGYAFKIGG